MSCIDFSIQVVTEVEKPFVKEKIAKVTVETAKQTWPQHWNSFLDDMSGVYSVGVS
jgi:hypothetical protein